MTIKQGDRLPEVDLVKVGGGEREPITTTSYLKGRKVALFAVPGAFTPTCSAKHLPGFVEQSGALKEKGVDEIACIAVNDAFVMEAWAKASGCGDKVTMLADGNGDFARAIGLVMDGSKFGMGPRSQRYSMIVDDGVVTQLNVESGGEFRVSAADYMVGQLSAA